MQPTFHIFVKDGAVKEDMLAVVSISVWEADGQRHMRVNGSLDELLEALLDSDGIMVAVNVGDFPEA
jgi:hypothetical protein